MQPRRTAAATGPRGTILTPSLRRDGMETKKRLRTPLCDLLGIEYPIILAGMGGAAGPRLAAAVSNAGGLGVIGATGYTPDEMRELIRKVRSLTDKPFGID